MIVPVNSHTNSVVGFPSLQSLSSIYWLWVFDDSHSDWWYLIVLICIFVIISSAEHIFMCLLSICVSSFEKYLFRSSAHVFIGLFVFMFPGGLDGKASAYSAGDLGSIPGSGRSPGEGNGNPLHFSCLKKSHGWRNLAGYSPWGCKESDTTEQLTFSLSVSEINRVVYPH